MVRHLSRRYPPQNITENTKGHGGDPPSPNPAGNPHAKRDTRREAQANYKGNLACSQTPHAEPPRQTVGHPEATRLDRTLHLRSEGLRTVGPDGTPKTPRLELTALNTKGCPRADAHTEPGRAQDRRGSQVTTLTSRAPPPRRSHHGKRSAVTTSPQRPLCVHHKPIAHRRTTFKN